MLGKIPEGKCYSLGITFLLLGLALFGIFCKPFLKSKIIVKSVLDPGVN